MGGGYVSLTPGSKMVCQMIRWPKEGEGHPPPGTTSGGLCQVRTGWADISRAVAVVTGVRPLLGSFHAGGHFTLTGSNVHRTRRSFFPRHHEPRGNTTTYRL